MRTCCVTTCLLAVCLAAPAEAAKLKVPGDHATIQAAVNAAGAGDVIEVAQGTYDETVTITGKNGLTLRAKKGDKVAIDAADTGVPLLISNAHFVTVQDLRLRNSNSNGLGISLASFISIEKCSIADAAGSGISASGAGIVIDRCSVKGTGLRGIYLQASNSVVRDTTVKNSASYAILVHGSVNTIEGNTVDVPSRGISLGGSEACASCLVLDNHVENASDGIYLEGNATGSSVLDNTIEDAQFEGIELQTGAENNVVSGNTIRSTGQNGLECDSEYCLHSKNKILDPAGAGVVIEANASNCHFHKNKVTSAGGDGFHVDGTMNNLIENQAKKSGVYDLDDNTAPGANLMLNNKFKTVAP